MRGGCLLEMLFSTGARMPVAGVLHSPGVQRLRKHRSQRAADAVARKVQRLPTRHRGPQPPLQQLILARHAAAGAAAAAAERARGPASADRAGAAAAAAAASAERREARWRGGAG